MTFVLLGIINSQISGAAPLAGVGLFGGGNDGTQTTATAAATYDLTNQYVVGGDSAFATPKYSQYRVSFTTSGTTDNKNIINGTITLRKSV